MSNPLSQVQNFKQSIWYDNIQRSLLQNGKIKEMIAAKEIYGITSNPTIFDKAIGGSDDYNPLLTKLLQKNPRTEISFLYEELVIQDIREAADLLYPVYENAQGQDGFVSIEVSPELAHDTEKTVAEAQHLFKKIDRKNVMVKVPATTEGVPVIEELISQGINVNVTLMFSLEDFTNVSNAYIAGLEKLEKSGKDISKVSSVASFFISRMDSAVDKVLPENSELRGKVAIAYAKNVYQKFLETYSSPRFTALKEKGAYLQRLLWASTGVKNPQYRDCLYVEELMGADTVNTVPPATLDAFRDHGQPAARVTGNMDEVAVVLTKVTEQGVDLEQIAVNLKREGVIAFKESFQSLLTSIEGKKQNIIANLLPTQKLTGRKDSLDEKKNLAKQIANKDAHLWAFKDVDLQEVSERLGWLDSVEELEEKITDLTDFALDIKDHFAKVVLLGMGGSSLAPEVFMKIFGNQTGFPPLQVIDTTNPSAISEILENLNFTQTLFIVSSKSGSTIETASLLELCYAQVSKTSSNPGSHFVAITDSGSKLEKIGQERSFRRVFIAPSNVGGRYSVFTYFGMVPAALLGISLSQLHKVALRMQKSIGNENLEDNNSVSLGVFLGEYAKEGRNKLTLFFSPSLVSFGDWVEQLVAESTGKLGKGIVPIVNEKVLAPKNYKNDRIFVITHMENESIDQYHVDELSQLGHPTIVVQLRNKYNIGAEFLRWEVATAVAGSILEINPFDQPDVELAKIKARECMTEYSETKKISSSVPNLVDDSVEIYCENVQEDVGKDGIIHSLLQTLKECDYFSIMAYLPMDDEVKEILQQMRTHVQKTCKVATTIGFGPRFLHSTGQLHKGDNNSGVFLQITHTCREKLEVPNSSYDFNTLILAQAVGDYKALKEKQRRVLRYHIDGSLMRELKSLRNIIENYE